ncbi:E3 SUMO-protein ligase KIAA1586-like [Melanaphis sacchari]|uniref:E3 SUMO-protein ligase KIAA1586-like n=1 Tax=Melanaphis sacchari TaxID=742174 RepID=UPI000DC1394F|nr:E3 SUMO-protein ligase KIAA1586-like [Melanaphis sacchari]
MNKRQQFSISDFFNKKKKNDQVNNKDHIAVNNSLCQPIEFTRDDDTPECWDSKQAKYFCEEYPWLYFKNKKLGCNICHKVNLNLNKNQVSHVHVSSNWIQCDIVPTGNNISKQQASLRKKISKHKCSQSHISAENIIHRKKIFRTAYFIAKNQRPFLDMPKLIDLQALNGVNMGRVLQTNKSCANIVDHISNEMRLKICNDIIENNRKLCIVVDESTTLSKKTMLVICLRCANGDSQEINIFFFFDIIELNCTSAESIKTAIINNMLKHGIKLDFLKQNLVGFVSDGASNMLGRKAGVGVLLQKIFPDLIIWHCYNHRLELAVSDTIKEVQGLNHFQCFFEKLYSLYHQSPKNMTELNACAASLESTILNIGKIFTIRWVASSFRTVRAVWNNYVALHKHFQESSTDNKRDGKEDLNI